MVVINVNFINDNINVNAINCKFLSGVVATQDWVSYRRGLF